MKDESQIIERVLKGDVDAFAPIVETYKGHVLRIVTHMVSSGDVEEVAHEVFIRAFKDLSGYRREAPFEHWLARISVRTCYDHWRRQKRIRVSAVSPEQFEAMQRSFVAAEAVESGAVERAKELLDTALAHLAPQDRLVIALMYFEDRSVKEIAGMLNWSVAQVKVRAFRARRALKRLVSEGMASR